MGHTNETANVELSQFLGTDKPAWLVDYNGDMAKLDAYIYAVKVKADANESAITSLGNRVTTVENDITNTITPALTAAQNNITTLRGNITTINSLIGNGTPTTTDQTIIGAINEINANVTGDKSVSASGVDISGYTSASPYKAPSAGYVNLGANASSSSELCICDSQGNLICNAKVIDDTKLVYVPKGLYMYINITGTGVAIFDAIS